MSKILLNIRKWLRRLSIQNKSDIYVFYSGHGLQPQMVMYFPMTEALN